MKPTEIGAKVPQAEALMPALMPALKNSIGPGMSLTEPTPLAAMATQSCICPEAVPPTIVPLAGTVGELNTCSQQVWVQVAYTSYRLPGAAFKTIPDTAPPDAVGRIAAPEKGVGAMTCAGANGPNEEGKDSCDGPCACAFGTGTDTSAMGMATRRATQRRFMAGILGENLR
jgi:hypothetical protein